MEDNIHRLKIQTHKALDKIDEDEIEAGHVYILVADYLFEMSNHVRTVIKTSLNHIDNNHKTLLPAQIKELQELNTRLKDILISIIKVFKSMDQNTSDEFLGLISGFIKQVRTVRKKQLKRVKNREIGTRISMLCLNHMAEMRNLVLFSNRIVRVCQDLLMSDIDEDSDDGDIEIKLENLDFKNPKE